MKEIIIYSTPSCVYCKLAKEFFQKEGLAYTEFDVKQDEVKREEMIQLTGQRGVPVIVIDGKVHIGFLAKDLRAALA